MVISTNLSVIQSTFGVWRCFENVHSPYHDKYPNTKPYFISEISIHIQQHECRHCCTAKPKQRWAVKKFLILCVTAKTLKKLLLTNFPLNCTVGKNEIFAKHIVYVDCDVCLYLRRHSICVELIYFLALFQSWEIRVTTTTGGLETPHSF